LLEGGLLPPRAVLLDPRRRESPEEWGVPDVGLSLPAIARREDLALEPRGLVAGHSFVGLLPEIPVDVVPSQLIP
jgi:hypothetical protein